MDRFTKRDEYGNADIIGVESEDLQAHLKINEMNRVTFALNKLAHYEDLAEQGRLIEIDLNNHKRDDLDRCTHRHCNNCDKYRRELQHYKDLAEAGRLVEGTPVDFGYLADWYISSVMDDEEPVWTDAHIDELLRDFTLIPKPEGEAEAKLVKEGGGSDETD